jgi:hypothetical protein
VARTRSNKNTLVAEVDGSLLFWINGEFSGDDEALVSNARLAAMTHLTTLLTANGPALVADDTEPRGAVAALMAARPGRVRIVEAPAAIWDLYPEDENASVVTVIDGVVQDQAEDLYTTDAIRARLVPQDDPRVKLVAE